MNNNLPPLMPDDFAALAGLAKNMYQESKTVESFVSQNPLKGEDKNSGSRIIKEQLEQAQRLAQANARQYQQYLQQTAPQQPIITPAIIGGPSDPIPQDLLFPSANLPTPLPPTPVPQEPVAASGQLELSFDPSTQDITNNLLREISAKLSKVLVKLEENDLKPKRKGRKPLEKKYVNNQQVNNPSV